MLQNIWKYGRVLAVTVAILAMVAGGTADAKRGGVGKTVESAEVTDGTLTGGDVQDGALSGADVKDGALTGADIDQSTLRCGGPGGIPGCGPSAAPAPGSPPAPPATLTTQLGTNASQPIGYPAIKTATARSTCPAGTKAVSGLVDILGAGEPDNVYLTAFGPSVDGTQFFATAKATNSNPSVPARAATLRVFAVCLG